ncbi:MAG: hypothetical protein JRI22_14010 [Deltaproteobacteria bacterium]|nr:hypothetical protein [Deltaproteobacteria bacterium]
MSHEEAAAIGRKFREIITHYLSLLEKVQEWQERVRRYRGDAPLDRAVREAVSRLWHLRRPTDLLEQMSQFRRSYGGMASLMAPGDQKVRNRADSRDNSPHTETTPMAKGKEGGRIAGPGGGKRRCQAVAELTGEQCRRPAVSDSPFCHRHRD